jgi:hypothetical protein
MDQLVKVRPTPRTWNLWAGVTLEDYTQNLSQQESFSREIGYIEMASPNG